MNRFKRHPVKTAAVVVVAYLVAMLAVAEWVLTPSGGKAEVKGVSYEEIARITTENAFRCFSKMPQL